ncbi:MAG: hypothetical protein Q9191_006374 [Dirinaria sp. TL-2023a]
MPEEGEFDLFLGYHSQGSDALFRFTPAQYKDGLAADTRGTANPSVMEKPYWKYVISRMEGASEVRETLSHDPFFQNIVSEHRGPQWCFDRYGMTFTRIPDGRLICIGGAHGGVDNPDHCVYNDVTVISAPPPNHLVKTKEELCDPSDWSPPNDEEETVFVESKRTSLLTPRCMAIYGYPTSVLPPVSFHTASYLVDPATGKECIFIIGGVGYTGSASHNQTDVYRLDLSDFSIHRLQTLGEPPKGGMFSHEASVLGGEGGPLIQMVTKEDETCALQVADLTWLGTSSSWAEDPSSGSEESSTEYLSDEESAAEESAAEESPAKQSSTEESSAGGSLAEESPVEELSTRD